LGRVGWLCCSRRRLYRCRVASRNSPPIDERFRSLRLRRTASLSSPIVASGLRLGDIVRVLLLRRCGGSGFLRKTPGNTTGESDSEQCGQERFIVSAVSRGFGSVVIFGYTIPGWCDFPECLPSLRTFFDGRDLGMHAECDFTGPSDLETPGHELTILDFPMICCVRRFVASYRGAAAKPQAAGRLCDWGGRHKE